MKTEFCRFTFQFSRPVDCVGSQITTDTVLAEDIHCATKILNEEYGLSPGELNLLSSEKVSLFGDVRVVRIAYDNVSFGQSAGGTHGNL